MGKNYLFLVFGLFLVCITQAQEVGRILILGQLVTAGEESVEGINIYNISSQKGAVSNENGEFAISVGVNDHVLFSALQFQDFTVMISEKDVLEKRLVVRLDQAINSLDEVVIRSIDLTGVLNEDVKNIKTTTLDGEQFNMSYEALQYGYKFEQDYKTGVDGNAAENAINSGGMKNGFNPLGFVDLLFPKKKKQPVTKNREVKAISKQLKDKYTLSFFVSNFKIPESKVIKFLYFVEERMKDSSLLDSENELILMKELHQLSNTFNAKPE